MSLHAFPKIFAIGSDYIADIFKEPVEITEKVDGSQFVFGKFDGEIRHRSKGKEIFFESVDNMFREAVDVVYAIDDHMCLPDGVAFYCEYLKKPKHNVLAYGGIPLNHLALFACNMHGKFVHDWDKLATYADAMTISVVPRIYSGMIESADMLLDMLDRESYLGGQKIEGVVVKNYDRPFLLGGQPIPLMAGKYVSEKFKEKHQKDWKKGTGKGKFELFKEGFRTAARWEKAVQHLRDSGDLDNSPRDIGSLIREIQSDIKEEHEEEIRNWLYNQFSPEIFRFAIRGFPEWYKKQLMKRSFECDQDAE